MKHKKKFRRYIPWFSSVPGPEEDKGKNDDDFVGYVYRNLHPYFGEESPFPGSEWSYTKRESVFDRDESNDFDLHQDVINALYGCDELDASEINVNVINGVVILSGYVQSEREKEIASNVIFDIAGVWNVRNEITVDPESISRSA